MRLRILFILVITFIFSESVAQSDFNKMVRDSEVFRTVAERLVLEPGSIHIIETTYFIEKDGSISNISASSEYPEFEAEAIRIIGTLPKFVHSTNGGPVNFPHKISMPITYRVETTEIRKLRFRKEARGKKKT